MPHSPRRRRIAIAVATAAPLVVLASPLTSAAPYEETQPPAVEPSPVTQVVGAVAGSLAARPAPHPAATEVNQGHTEPELRDEAAAPIRDESAAAADQRAAAMEDERRINRLAAVAPRETIPNVGKVLNDVPGAIQDIQQGRLPGTEESGPETLPEKEKKEKKDVVVKPAKKTQDDAMVFGVLADSGADGRRIALLGLTGLALLGAGGVTLRRRPAH